MGNILRILKRDFLRLLKAPAALIVVGALLVLPSVYTWYNVVGFWDPYGNTSGMRVAVVNQDKGGTSELTGEINVGDKIIEALGKNEQLDWVYDDYDTAMDDLYSGLDYAVFVVPEDFTADLLTLTTGNFVQPQIEYYVNEKTGPVSPKITDTGASTLEETINATFVETVSNAAVEAIVGVSQDANDSVNAFTSQAASQIQEVVQSVAGARESLSQMDSKLADAEQKRQSAYAALDPARQGIQDAAAGLDETSKKALEAEKTFAQESASIQSSMSDAMKKLNELQASAAAAGKEAELKAAIDALNSCMDAMYGEKGMVPTASAALISTSTTSAQLSATVSGQELIIDESKTILDQLGTTIETAREALAQTDSLLASLQSDLDTVRVDLLALSGSSAMSSISNALDSLDANSIASFMGSPTTVKTEKLYELNAYGSAMAPLFMNLTFWIGAFMLLIIMKQEVDEEGIRKMTAAQRYLGRFIMFALFAVVQSVVCCAGVLFLGVEAVDVPALFLAAALASLAYLSIIYSLSILLQHVGKGLCIILIFLQIPAATGLYPIEMTADFYQSISPLFPFTYGINAMREAICGFYGLDYLKDLGILAAFLVGFLLLGVLANPLTANLNRMFAAQIREGGIFNGDAVEVPERRVRLLEAASIISDRAEYRRRLEQSYEHFLRMYPKILHWGIGIGIAVPVVLGLAFSLNAGEKAILLTLWLVWTLLVFAFLIVMERMRYDFKRQFELGGMDEQDLRQLYSMRNSFTTDDGSGAGEGDE